jgi:hypothetical protein
MAQKAQKLMKLGQAVNPYTTPRTVSIAELRLTLLPYMQGVPWAEDALMDLWRMGAPEPNASLCPFKTPCKERECAHIKRVLLPSQFAKWWADVCARQGLQQVVARPRVAVNEMTPTDFDSLYRGRFLNKKH